MDIKSRNLLRLLKAGVMGINEDVEPMSAWKWRRIYDVAVEQNVVEETMAGIKCLQNQFFLQLPSDLIETWGTLRSKESSGNADTDRLASRLNRRTYQHIKKQSTNAPAAFDLLNISIDLAHHIIGDGLFLRPLILMAQKQPEAIPEEYISWMKELHMERMVQLQMSLTQLLRKPSDQEDLTAELTIDSLFDHRHVHNQQLHFQQTDGQVFVHTSNTRAMLWQAQRSAKYLRYCPSESISTLVSSIAHSLTDIEE